VLITLLRTPAVDARLFIGPRTVEYSSALPSHD
jgi:hypothetical protein